MSTSTAPRTEIPSTTQGAEPQRGLTLRSVVVCIFALLLMGMWIEYQERFIVGGPFAENAPPNSAVSVILILLAISALLYRFRRSFRLTVPELVVIFSALLVAAPLMTQGMWGRFFGLLAAIPHEQDFKSYDSLPDVLWPHGKNLVANPRFLNELNGYTVSKSGKLDWEEVEWKKKDWKSPRLSNGGDARARASIAFTINRRTDKGVEQLIPGERFIFSCLAKATGFQRGSFYTVKMQADDGLANNVIINSGDTVKTFANRGGFQRIGVCPVTIPSNLRDKLTLSVTLNGEGTVTLQDFQFLNVEAVEGFFTGRKMVRASHLKALGDERDFTVVRPDNLFTPPGLVYLMKGFIPLKQWAMPALAWTLLIGALFMGFFGFNVLMRRQWVEHERFTFPMNILPQQLFAEQTTSTGERMLAFLRNPIVWIGFAVTLPMVLLKGLHFYNPAIPAPQWTVQMDTFFTDPLMKLFFQNVSINILFFALAVALLIETDILFSIWAGFILFQFMFLFGKMFNFNRFNGYPWDWQQAIGSFTAFAFLAVIAARRHLARVFQHLTGRIKLPDHEEVVSYRTAVLMLVLSVIILAAWGIWTKMGAGVSLIFFGWMLVCGFTASKIRAEAGMPFGYWMPYYGMFFVSAVGGFAVFGTTGMLVATIASGFMCVSCFLFIAPVQVEMMELGRHFKVRPRDIGHGLFLGLLGGLFIGGFAVLCWGYGFGADNLAFTWPYKQNWYFNNYRVGELAADAAFTSGQLINPKNAPLDFIHNIDAKGVGIGFAVTCILAVLRSLFMWFPIHPLGYVLATTHFCRGMAFTLFLAWAIRSLVLRIGGVHSVRKGLIPFSVGMFFACMISIMLFEILGIILRANGVMQVYSAWP